MAKILDKAGADLVIMIASSFRSSEEAVACGFPASGFQSLLCNRWCVIILEPSLLGTIQHAGESRHVRTRFGIPVQQQSS